MTAVQLGLLIILLTAQVQTGLSSCPAVNDVLRNNWPEDQGGVMTSCNAPGVTGVFWKPDSSNIDHYDASLYVNVTLNEASGEIEFIALPSMAGVRDFPADPFLAKMYGTCLMECGGETGTFTFTAYVQDRNTADPAFSSDSYAVNVQETFPVDIVISNLVISASDADAEVTYNQLSFTLQGDSPFELTSAEKTDDPEATYTTQLKLKQPLDWATNPSYQLTITAEDPDGRKANATITVTVDDVDNMQPEFEQLTYSTTVDDPKLPGPLHVSIKAVDPDAPGSLKYTLLDTTGGQWSEYFSLDPNTAELRLTKDVTDQLQPYPTTVTFLLQATEDGGNYFYCRSALVVNLPVMDLTTTAAPTPPPSPSPCPIRMFTQRQYLASTTENYTGDVITVTADPAAGDVTYFLRTPGYEDSFHLDEDSGTLHKLEELNHQRVSLLVQAIPVGGSAKNQTNNTDVVNWDETLIMVDIADENDSPPVLHCSAYPDNCNSIVIGFPASETAALPTPLLRLTVTDADTGVFGVDGIEFTVDSSALKIDSSGMLYLIEQQSDPFSATVTATDNKGAKPYLTDTAQITLVPVRDDQIFYIRTDSQLTDVDSVTSLLRQIAAAGQYRAVLSLDFQPIRTTDKSPAQVGLTNATEGSTIYIYAVRKSGTAFVAVDSEDIKEALTKTETDVEYIKTKDAQKTDCLQ